MVIETKRLILNIPSQNVAKRNGMTCIDTFIKHYRGVDMPHLVFVNNNYLLDKKTKI